MLQDSRVQPSNNPDDATGTATAENFIPPEDLVTRPAEDGEGTDTTLTSAATLGSSPVVNPTDPALGDEGIVSGGSYSGGSGGTAGGGEVTPTSMSAEAPPLAGGGDELSGKQDVNGATVDMVTGQMIDARGTASALGGEGETDLPITVEPAPPAGASALGGGETDLPITVRTGSGGASALGGGDTDVPITVRTGPASATGSLEQKTDVNGASIDMVTGQVIGSAAPATGGELGTSGTLSQGDEGDGEDEDVQSFGTSSAFATAAPLSAGFAAGGLVSQGDEGDGEDEDVQAFGAADPGLAIGGDPGFASGDPGAPGALEGPPAMGDDGPPLPGDEG